MNATPRQKLREEFYLWEQLGRGELVWDVPVLPEPYFVPFFGHGAFTEETGVRDDGRRETIFSRWFSGKRPSTPKPTGPQPFEHLLAPLLSRTAPEYTRDTRATLNEATWLLPAECPWKPATWEPLLYSLSMAQHPLCLEMIATAERITFQWVFEEDDSEPVRDALAGANTAIEETSNVLAQALLESEPSCLWNRELALSREFVFPIASDFTFDPYTDLLAAFGRLREREIAVVQITFQPCACRWAESIWRLVTLDSGQPFFEGGKDFMAAAKEKCSKPLFAVRCRLWAGADDDERVETIAVSLGRSFGCFEEANGFTFADSAEQSFDDRLEDLLHRRSRRSGMLLSGDELLGLIHPPATGLGSPKLERTLGGSRAIPAAHQGKESLLLGLNVHQGQAAPATLSVEDRLRHMHVLGASGTGKSTFLLNCILQDLHSGSGFALLDPHGDLVDAVLEHIPPERIEDVAIFDPSDAEFPVGFNILRAHSDVERNLLASDFVAIFERLSSSWGDQMTAVLGNAAMAFLESVRGGTLLDLKRFLIEKGFRDSFLKTVRDSEVRYFWTHEFPLLRGNTQASLITRLNGFLRHRLVRNMVAQSGERFDVGRMMDEGKIILARLSQGLIGQENSWLLGSLLVSRFYQAALSRQAVDESRRRPFWLYLDEAHNFVTPSIASILSGARKYGLGLVLSHQELGQFPARESGILSSILTNCQTRVCFRLGDRDANSLASGFTHFEESQLRRLSIGEAICRIGGSDDDFNLTSLPPPEIAPDRASRPEVVDASRARYATPVAELENPATEQGGAKVEVPGSFRVPVVPKARKSIPSEPPSLPAWSQFDDPREPVEAPLEPPPEAEPDPSEEDAAEQGAESSGPLEKTPGRGGARHKFIQQLVKQHGNGLGLRATVEAQLPDGSGRVDVLLEGQSISVAFEFADGSPLSQEVRNIEKALQNGIGSVVVVADNAKHLEAVRKAAEEAGLAGQEVSFLETAEIGGYFQSLGAGLADYETTSRGYKVRVKHAALSEEEEQERRAAIHRAIAEHRRERNEGGSA